MSLFTYVLLLFFSSLSPFLSRRSVAWQHRYGEQDN
jgi:hypothetical protein